MNVSESFTTLLSRIQPTNAENSAAQGHIATIKTRLNATFTLNRIVVSGSFARGTLVPEPADSVIFGEEFRAVPTQPRIRRTP